MRFGFSGAAALLAAALVCAAPAAAQTATGSISGVVQDETKATIPGASVTVTNVDTGIARSLTTDEGGRYHVPGLISGPYEVQAQLQDFRRRSARASSSPSARRSSSTSCCRSAPCRRARS
jgi:hypothetical protein